MHTKILRPTCFEDVVGNKAVVDAIKNSIEIEKTGHKIFLTGPCGVGKTTLARIIAMQLLNASSEEQLEKHLDYHEIDCTRFGSSEFIRKFVYNLCYGPSGKGPVVHFFDECAAMHPAAQNVLLKSIEDAKDYHVFIFATSEPEKILNALMQRFTHRELKRLTKTDILRNLERVCRILNVYVEKCVLIDIALKSDCNTRKSLGLLEDFIKMADHQKQKYIEAINRKKTGSNNCQSTCDKSENHEYPGENSLEKEPVTSEPGETDENNKASDTPVITNDIASTSNRYLEALTKAAMTSADIIKTDYPVPRCFLAPFISEGSLTMIYAVAGVGKSWLSMLVALGLTRSKYQDCKFASFQVVEQCGVVIVDAELSGYDLKQRLSQLSGPFGEENTLAPLTIVNSAGIADNLDTPIDLDDENWRKSLYLYMKNNSQNKVLILDNLSSLCGGHSESSREAITPINRWLLSLKRLGLAVILIHHSNKSGGYRGHSSRIDNLDTVLSLTRLKNADELHFEVKFEKARTAKPGDAKSFILEAKPHPDNPEWLSWNWYDKESDDTPSGSNKDDEIMAYLMLHKFKQREVAEHFKVSQSKVSNCLRKAIDAGYITEEKEVTEAGKQFLEKMGFDKDDPELEVAE